MKTRSQKLFMFDSDGDPNGNRELDNIQPQDRKKPNDDNIVPSKDLQEWDFTSFAYLSKKDTKKAHRATARTYQVSSPLDTRRDIFDDVQQEGDVPSLHIREKESIKSDGLARRRSRQKQQEQEPQPIDTNRPTQVSSLSKRKTKQTSKDSLTQRNQQDSMMENSIDSNLDAQESSMKKRGRTKSIATTIDRSNNRMERSKVNDRSQAMSNETSSDILAMPAKIEDISMSLMVTPNKMIRSSSGMNSISKQGTHSGKKSRERIEPGSLRPPKDWEDIYLLVQELRADKTAPVDTDGCVALAEREKDPTVFRFQVLIALMLSSQTKDAVVGETMKKLQQHGLTVDNIRSTSSETLNALIQKVGFHNNKTKYIKATAEILSRDFQGDIPSTAAELMELPGVGPKMAYIAESVAWGNSTGIGVDTHMHRMFNDLGWVSKGSTTPERTREQLEGWLPKDKWDEVNVLWVGFGQETQQQKEKVLRKALACSKPLEALRLLKRVGVNISKEAKRYGLEMEIKSIMQRGNQSDYDD